MPVLIALAGIVAIGVILKGFVLTILWSWFIVPIFGLPELGLVQAMGLSLIVSYLTHQAGESNGKEERTALQIVGRLIGVSVFMPFLALFFGWIIHLFL